jgi:hypothetical protein
VVPQGPAVAVATVIAPVRNAWIVGKANSLFFTVIAQDTVSLKIPRLPRALSHLAISGSRSAAAVTVNDEEKTTTVVVKQPHSHHDDTATLQALTVRAEG